MSQATRIDRLENNRLINGSFDFWQRGGASSAVNLSTTATYYADRWRALISNAAHFTGNVTVQKEDLSPNFRTEHCLKLTSTVTTAAATITHHQRVERFLVKDLAASTASLGFYVNSASATTVTVNLYTTATQDDWSGVNGSMFYTTNVTIPATSTWQQIKLENISVPSTGANGIQVEIIFTNFSVLNSSVLHRIAQVMLVGGVKASEWNWAGRNYIDELAMCQRYYEKSYDLSVNPSTATVNGEVTAYAPLAGTIGVSVRFRVEKRAAPTMFIVDRNQNANAVLCLSSGAVAASRTAVVTGVTTSCFFVSATTSTEVFMAFHFTADAEI